jgi:hypothetical protein
VLQNGRLLYSSLFNGLHANSTRLANRSTESDNAPSRFRMPKRDEGADLNASIVDDRGRYTNVARVPGKTLGATLRSPPEQSKIYERPATTPFRR